MYGGLSELEARGFIRQCTNTELLRELLHTQQLTFYCGFDPTADSLSIG